MNYQTTNRITGNRRWIAFAAVLVTLFFSSLDQTIVSTALPTVIADLKGFEIYAWVFTAYMITSAIAVPIYGKLSDVYGRKPFYIFGLVIFMVGSALSGQAHSMIELILARGIQGLGGGALLSMPRATIGDIFNPKERAKWMGVTMSVFGLASIIGPFLGGWITDQWNWRWIFYINLPVAVIALVAVYYALPKVRQEGKHHVDWLGTIFLALGLVPILLAFTWAGTRYAWSSGQILGLFVFGLVLLIVFVFIEKKSEEPVISPTLFKNHIFVVTAILGLLISVSMFGSLMFLPIFVQGVLGLSAQNSGEVMTPMMLSFIVGSVVGGIFISRTGKYKIQAVIASVIMVLGIFLLTRMNTLTTWPIVVRNMIVIGIGVGSIMPLVNIVVQNAFPYKMLGVVNSTQQFVSSLGGIIIAPIYGTILASTFNKELALNLPPQLVSAMSGVVAKTDPQVLITAQAQEAIKAKFIAFGPSGIDLYNKFIEAVKLSLTSGVTRLFLIGTIFAVLTLIATFFLKEIPLKRDDFYKDDEEKVDEAS
ncbi:MAG: MDR family MFS transporter [Bacillota bacterium]